jgi:hypothetical protein
MKVPSAQLLLCIEHLKDYNDDLVRRMKRNQMKRRYWRMKEEKDG